MISALRRTRNSLFQLMARFLPLGNGTRLALHRWRGVRIGKDVFINHDVIIETIYPERVAIGDRANVGMRTTIAAHLHVLPARTTEPDGPWVTIEDDVNIGTGVIVLPNVTIGRGAVVAAGSVVSRSVAPLTMVQGVPARPVARCGIPLGWNTPMKEFLRNLRPLPAAKGVDAIDGREETGSQESQERMLS